jgi:hypothetical protein
MANPKQLAILQRGVEEWNIWSRNHREEKVDLSNAHLNGANLRRAHLNGADLSQAHLNGADLREANLIGANLFAADLSRTDLSLARLEAADLSGAFLSGAFLSGANLYRANLNRADLRGVDLRRAFLSDTVFGNTDLTGAKGLDSCVHAGPSIIDHGTLAKSGALRLAFLRGVGLPERLIEYLPSLLNEPFQFYACFISYSHHYEAFTQRLHSYLQGKGVRCWFAPEDVQGGKKIHEQVDEAIRRYDKLLLILSTASIASNWVEHEIRRARRGKCGRIEPARRMGCCGLGYALRSARSAGP